MGFNESLQNNTGGLEGVNIDNLRPYAGTYIYWGGTPPTGDFPIGISSQVSIILIVHSVAGMSIQTMYTGLSGMGSLNHKYERVYTDRWGAWTDMGTINSPH